MQFSTDPLPLHHSCRQVIFQYLPPGFYWGSEVCYCVLSLVAKLWLGLLMLFNVIMTESTAEQSLGGEALESAR